MYIIYFTLKTCYTSIKRNPTFEKKALKYNKYL